MSFTVKFLEKLLEHAVVSAIVLAVDSGASLTAASANELLLGRIQLLLYCVKSSVDLCQHFRDFLGGDG